MTDYTKTTDFTLKDNLPPGDSGKIIRGSEFDLEFGNVALASATKADLISPTFVGTVTTPDLSVTATATANAFVGDGSGLTNLPAGAASSLQAVTDVGATTTNAITTAGLTSNGVVSVTGNIIVSGTVDGRDVNADGVKLDGIEPLADVTDTTNVTAALSSGTGIDISVSGQISNTAPDQTVALTQGGATTVSGTYPNFTISSTDTTYTDADVDTHLNTSTATASEVLSWTGSDYDWVSVAGTTPSLQAVTDIGSSTTNSITANAFVGDGSGLTNLPAGSTNTLEQVTTAGNTTTNDIAFADNTKATFGAGNDLQIYHDVSASYVSDQGTGPLKLLTNSLQVRNSADSENLIVAHQDGAVTLYHDNVAKIATTAAGIDVDGTATMDGLTINRSGVQSRGIEWNRTGTIDAAITLDETEWLHYDNYFNNGHRFRTGAAGAEVDHMTIEPTGDVGIGIINPDNKLAVIETGAASPTALTTSGDYAALFGSSTTSAAGVTQGIMISGGGTNNRGVALLAEVQSTGNNTDFIIATSNAGATPTEKMRVLDTGQVGIGTSAPTYPLVVSNSGAEGIEFKPAVTAGVNNTVHYNRSGAAYVVNRTLASQHEWRNGSSNEVMRIDPNGKVLIGGTSVVSATALDEGIHLQSTTDGDTIGYSMYVADGVNNRRAVLFLDDTTGTYGFNSTYGSGPVDFIIQSVGSERLRLSDTGQLDITTSSVNSETMARFSTSGGVRAVLNTDSDDDGAFSLYDKNDDVRVFVRATGSSYLTGGNVGINTSSPQYTLDVAGTHRLANTTSVTTVLQGAAANSKNIIMQDTAGNQQAKISNLGTNGLALFSGTGEALRIDAARNVLIGTTNNAPGLGNTTDGISLLANGAGIFSRTAGTNATTYVNRSGSDGDCSVFLKDGAVVGSIGTRANYITIGTGDTNLLFNSAANAITPEGDGAGSTGIIDLGRTTSRFKDLHLSGGIVTTTGNVTVSDKPIYANTNTGLSSSDVTFSTAAPSGGNDGDIWYQY